MARRKGADPAMFATELEILAVRGFGDMGTCARNRMVRDRFIQIKSNQMALYYALLFTTISAKL